MTSVPPVTPIDPTAQLNDGLSVRLSGAVFAGAQPVPPGATGIVIAQYNSGAVDEVRFSPPVSAVEPVAQNLLAVA